MYMKVEDEDIGLSWKRFVEKEKKTHSVMPFLTRAPSPSFWSFAKTFLITCLVTLSESQEADIVMMMELGSSSLYILFTFQLPFPVCVYIIYSHRERDAHDRIELVVVGEGE